jgi:hypothetical protein
MGSIISIVRVSEVSMRILTVALILLITVSLYASADSDSGRLAKRVAELEARVAELEEILQFVRVETKVMEGLTGPHWIIEGANVHVRSGAGDTSDRCLASAPDYPNCKSLTGLGNLIVGYNERINVRSFPSELRTGSHSLVVGRFQSYSSFGGFVAGSSNEITAAHASVCGGTDNKASGQFSSVSGGHGNLASGAAASVSGGELRTAPDNLNWAAGELFEQN